MSSVVRGREPVTGVSKGDERAFSESRSQSISNETTKQHLHSSRNHRKVTIREPPSADVWEKMTVMNMTIKMAGLSLMAAILAVISGNVWADVDQNELATIVDQILNKYTPTYMKKNGRERRPMFSLAVTIPLNTETNKYDVSQVLDSVDDVMETVIKTCEVYTGTRLIAATILRWDDLQDQCPNGRVQWEDVLSQCPEGVKTWADVKEKCPDKLSGHKADHGEYRVLQNFNTFLNSQNKDDLLLFYSFASPCDQRCTNSDDSSNILESIKQIVGWTNHAFVFSYVFKPRGDNPINEDKLSQSLERLAGSVNLKNMFRCIRKTSMQCTSCSENDHVARHCYVDE